MSRGNGERYIKQGDYGSWSGCLVQVPGLPARLFSYSEVGIDGALAKAIKYRDACLLDARYQRPDPQRLGAPGVFWCNERARSNIGVVGVHLTDRYRVRKGRRRTRTRDLVAQLRLPDGMTLRASFSVGLYGYDEALRLAIAARAKFVREKARWVKQHGGRQINAARTSRALVWGLSGTASNRA